MQTNIEVDEKLMKDARCATGAKKQGLEMQALA
jgi:hypothetical protein